ncbi:hypothetical protein [Neptunicoccus cionae]|uniref:Uncharacterized protein n=1 Tax=Neptunicoccus cionae TaxID=2035344 RepID=A0A916QW40_9RHOB|nr:hypothetical protein [Amylibacter cionae]GGA17531.1 hypothetical protein GCM10011498_17670 [Amylibacter cionae]
MIGRIFIFIVALQLAMTSAFSHVMAMTEHCAEPIALHVQCGDSFGVQEQATDVAEDTEQDSKASGMVYCTGNICTEQLANLAPALLETVSNADLYPAEPQMALQSVFLSQLRPPLV